MAKRRKDKEKIKKKNILNDYNIGMAFLVDISMVKAIQGYFVWPKGCTKRRFTPFLMQVGR